MNNRVEKAFQQIDDSFNKLAQQNKSELDAALIKPIHDQYPFAQNGVVCNDSVYGQRKNI